MKRVEMTPKVQDLAELLEAIASGEMVLPDFQRDFDWTESDVRELLVTILCGWPAGSLLLLQGSTDVFHTRAFEFAPPPAAAVRYSVLDGQQRLTALYHALYDLGTHVFAVDWANLKDGKLSTVDEAVVFFRRAFWDRNLRSFEAQRLAGLLPFYSLRSPSDFYDWRDGTVSTAPQGEEEPLKQQLTNVYTSAIAQIHRYKFPVVVLESDLQPAAIARIFERVNRTGITLSAFDLMVARTYEPEWNLRERWDASRRDSYLLDRFLGEDGLPVLQALALRYSNDVRQGAVLALPKALVHEKWEEAVAATEAAISFVVRNCGVSDPSWLPYRVMILLLAGLAFESDLDAHTEPLRRWFFSRAFSLFYDVASNTRVVADLEEVRKALLDARDMAIPTASETVLFEATRRGQTAIWRAFLCTLMYRGARDLGGLPFSHPSGGEALVEAFTESIVPRGAPYGPKEPPPHLRALSLVLATRETARLIRVGGLNGLVAQSTDQESLETTLRSQLLPPPEEVAEYASDWRGLLSYRLKDLVAFLESEVGQRVEREEEEAGEA